MKEYVPFHHPIVWNVLKSLTPMLLSIDMMVYFVFNARMEYRKKKPVRKCNWLLYAVVTIPKYKKRAMDHVIYIKVLYDGTVYYPTVSTDDFLNTTNI